MPESPPPAALRLRRPNRDQGTPVPACLDALLPDEHLARLRWAAVERLDLTAFAAGLTVAEGGPGRAAADPQLLVARWRYATTQGGTSARALARLCVEHVAYLWLCGGVTMNYHSLRDFRVQHEAALGALMAQVLGRLHHGGLIAFDHVGQDGVRARASAGAASRHRQATLERSLAEAQAVRAAVGTTPEGGDDDPPPGARVRVARVEAALAALPAARAAKPAGKRAQARAPETDAEARVMKMADGGFRPADNIQLAAATAHQVIVGVAVPTSGSDLARAPAMVAQVRQRLGRLPADWLMDGGFAGLAAIEGASAEGARVLAPVPAPKDPARDPHRPLPADTAVLAAWRIRLGTDEAQATYRPRAATIECVNAQARSQYGLLLLRVRGRAKVRCAALWLARAHNLRLWVRHQPAATPPALAA